MLNNILNKLFLILALLIAAFPILPYIARSIISILLLVIIAVLAYTNKRVRIIENGKLLKTLILVLPFIAVLLSLFYSNNLQQGIKEVIQLLSLIVFPLIWLFSLNKRSYELIIKYAAPIFYFSVLILILYQITESFLNLEYLRAPLTSHEIKFNGFQKSSVIPDDVLNTIKLRRFRKFNSDLIDTHPTYLGLWGIFSIFLMLKSSFKAKNKIKILLLILGIIIIFSWLVLLSTRMPLVSGFFGLLVILFFSKINFKRKVISFILLILLSILPYLTINSFRTRVNEAINSGFTKIKFESNAKDFNSTNVRLGIYYCNMLLTKEKPIFGYGVGDVQTVLSYCQTNRVNNKIYSWKSFNTHNQYFYFLLCSGVLGLSLFLFMIFKTLKWAVKTNNSTYLFFLIIIYSVFITENVFARNDGILFFSYFNSIYFLINEQEK